MRTINVTQDEAAYKYDVELEELLCAHESVYFEKACCPGGTTDCACGGMDSIVCANSECTGIEQRDFNQLILTTS